MIYFLYKFINFFKFLVLSILYFLKKISYFLFVKIPLYLFHIIKTCFLLLSHSDKNKKISEETIETIQIETN